MGQQINHGQYIRSIDRQFISQEDTFLWLSRGDLKGGSESKIIATQDQAFKPTILRQKLLQAETDSKC
jgi:hypothetical protein